MLLYSSDGAAALHTCQRRDAVMSSSSDEPRPQSGSCGSQGSCRHGDGAIRAVGEEQALGSIVHAVHDGEHLQDRDYHRLG